MTELNLRPPSRYQDPAELEWFVRLTQEINVQRYLEIGSRWGDSLYAVMMNRGPTVLNRYSPSPAAIVIDIPESPEKSDSILATLEKISAGNSCFTAHYFGSSRNSDALLMAKSLAPFDLVFIDGDHTYDGVKADWHDYRRLAPIIAFHDVGAPDDWMSDGKPNGVGRFWRELKASNQFTRTEEFITPGANMGYGVVWR